MYNNKAIFGRHVVYGQMSSGWPFLAGSIIANVYYYVVSFPSLKLRKSPLWFVYQLLHCLFIFENTPTEKMIFRHTFLSKFDCQSLKVTIMKV